MKRKIKNNILFQPVKAKDYSKFFIALGKSIFHGYKGEFDKTALSFMDAGAALGLEETEERLAWQLIDRAIVRAITDLVDECKNSIPFSSENTFIKNVKKLDYDKEITIDSDFFARPRECQFIKDIQEILGKWLGSAGVSITVSETIVRRLPEFFVYALHDEWVSNSEKYSRLLNESPFSDSKLSEEEWDRYRAFLEKQVQESVFDEPFSLSQIYIPLCGYYIKEETERELPRNFDKDENNEQSEFNNVRPKKTSKIVVNLEMSIREWMKNDDKEDAIRIVSGGPGCGKSSFAKMLAASLSSTHNVLFIPLYKLDLKRDVKEVIGDFLISNRIFYKNPIGSVDQLLIIFDGLDELTQQGKTSIDAANDFTNQIVHMLLNHNYIKLQVRVIITGRELPVQSVETNFRREKQIIHVLPYHVDNKKFGNVFANENTYIDPDGLLNEDKRNLWWKNYGELSGRKYQGLPCELNKDELEDITVQPLLNYLLALSFERRKIQFSEKINLNEIYNDLFDAVYERGYQSPHKAIKGIKKNDYDRVMEEIAVSAWQGAGRTATLKDIEKRCNDNSLGHIFDNFKDKAKEGVTNLLTAFYFRDAGINDNDGNKSFEFTHKSFGEYLIARKIVRHLSQTKTAIELYEKKQVGWTFDTALENWIYVCSRSPIQDYIFKFLCDEIKRNSIKKVAAWQQMLCTLISHMLKNGMPYDKISNYTFLEKTRFSRNSEEVLLATLSACSRYTNKISKINWPSPLSAGEWISKLVGQRLWNSFTLSCLNNLDFSKCFLMARDLCEANLSNSSFESCDLERTMMHKANLKKANLKNARLWNTDLREADLREAIWGDDFPYFFDALLDGVKSDNEKVYHSYGLTCRSEGNYLSSIHYLNKAIEIDSTNAEYYNDRGITYNWLKEHTKAIIDFTKAIELVPNKAEYYNNRGISYSWLNMFHCEAEDFTKAIKLSPDEADYYRNRGLANRKLKRLDDALRDCIKAIELDPNNADYYSVCGDVYNWMDKYQEAINKYSKALELEPNNAEFYYQRGLNFNWTREFNEALKDKMKAIEIEPTNAKYYYGLGTTYRELKKYEKAVVNFEKATELAPWDADYFSALALVQYKIGRTDNALDTLDSAYKLNENSYFYYRNLGTIRLKVLKKKQGVCDDDLLFLFDKAIELTNSDFYWQLSNSYMRRGEYYLYIGDKEKSLADLKKSIELRKDNEYAWFYLSKYHEQMRDSATSEHCLYKAKKYGYLPEEDD